MTTADNDRALREIRQDMGLRVPSFRLAKPSGQQDFAAEHERNLEELTRRKLAEGAARDDTALVIPVDSLAEISLVIAGDGADLLDDARANIVAENHELAAEQLAEYLQLDPGHQEALYLRAYCLYRLDGPGQSREALAILRPLRDQQADAGLQDKVRELRHRLRRRLTPGEAAAYARAARADLRGAQDRIRAYLELAPEEGALSYLLAVGQALSGDLEQALDTATRGAREADTDRQQLARLARRLDFALVRQLAGPAVSALKAGDVRLARRKLSAAAARRQGSVLLGDFDSYLALLAAGPARKPPPAPRVPADRAEDLHSLIAASDCEQAAELLAAGRADQAERLLSPVLALVPRFPLVNFLYAACLFLLQRKPDRAHACAAIAQQDPGISQAAELLRAIESWQEALVIGPALEEYVAVMESVRDGASRTGLSALQTRLTALKGRMPQLREAARTEQGREVLVLLGGAIDRQLADAARAVQLTELVARFNQLAAQRTFSGGPQAARAQLSAILQEARQLRGQASGRANSAEREVLDKLITTISRILK